MRHVVLRTTAVLVLSILLLLVRVPVHAAGPWFVATFGDDTNIVSVPLGTVNKRAVHLSMIMVLLPVAWQSCGIWRRSSVECGRI